MLMLGLVIDSPTGVYLPCLSGFYLMQNGSLSDLHRADLLATTGPDEAKAVYTEVVMLPLIQSEAFLFPSIA